MTTTDMDVECRTCQRPIAKIEGAWVDTEATGDDGIWRETCDQSYTFPAAHEPAVRNYTVIGGNAYSLDNGFIICAAMRTDGTPDHDSWTGPAWGQIAHECAVDLVFIERVLKLMPTVVAET